MTQFVAVITLALLAVAAAPQAEAADKGKKQAQARLQNIKWGRRSDITSRYWPYHHHPNIRIY